MWIIREFECRTVGCFKRCRGRIKTASNHLMINSLCILFLKYTQIIACIKFRLFIIKPRNLMEPEFNLMGRDSSVGIATRYGLGGQGIESRWGARFSAPVQTGPEAHPASCTMDTGSFLGVKRPGRGADHPPPSKWP